MSYWLYEHVVQDNDSRAPHWALQSTLNWIKALNYEIAAEHGQSTIDQYVSCQKIFRQNCKSKGVNLSIAKVFEPLFHSLTFCNSLISINRTCHNLPWVFPSAVVSWYYCYYNAMRAILCANNQEASENHSSVIKSLNSGMRKHLPYPLNMVAKHVKDETYTVELPSYPEIQNYDLVKPFVEDRDIARAMLVKYLSGTASYETERTKENILKNKKTVFKDFRTKEAREQRNSQLQKEINFLHCAFRYRGKANYRDAIYITYGRKEPLLKGTFTKDLASTAKFAFLCALAYAEYQLGKNRVKFFLNDLHANLRGITEETDEEAFWKDIVID